MGIISVLAGLFLIGTGLGVHVQANRSEAIPDPPAFEDFTIQATQETSCGKKIIAHDRVGKQSVLYTKGERVIKIARGIGARDFEGWLDINGDGQFDRYYQGPDGADMLLIDYPNPCKLS